MDLRIDVGQQGSWTVLGVGGEIDVATAPRLRDQMIAALSEGKHNLVVNLEAVDFIDSTGLGVLISGLKRVKTHGGEFRLVSAEQRLLKIFEITGLDAVFNIHPSVDEATAQPPSPGI
ncbi:MAG: STAS domain-containing protein [Acidimicrobiales bacterium]|nr:STAS domain-containing protein [Acidimicrobiales bacterium]